MYYKGFSAEETRVAWARAAELGANCDDFSERSAVRHAQWTLAIVRGELRAAQELASTLPPRSRRCGAARGSRRRPPQPRRHLLLFR